MNLGTVEGDENSLSFSLKKGTWYLKKLEIITSVLTEKIQRLKTNK